MGNCLTGGTAGAGASPVNLLLRPIPVYNRLKTRETLLDTGGQHPILGRSCMEARLHNAKPLAGVFLEYNSQGSQYPYSVSLATWPHSLWRLPLPPTYAQSNTPARPASAPATNHQRQATADQTVGAYYHYALAHSYEEMATTYGRPDYATRAIEEYKLALNADPESQYLNAHLAELYFQTGRVRDAITAAQDEIKKNPENLEAHKLLGRIYLRSLGNMQNGGPSDQMLKLAIDEYAKIVQLEPNSTENRLLLGRLYTLNHDSVHAEEQFKAAQKIDPDSEDVVLNIAGLYSEQGDNKRAIQVLTALPDDDQTTEDSVCARADLRPDQGQQERSHRLPEGLRS